MVWASSRLDSRIYGWTLPDLQYVGAVEVGPTANWMTSTPDSRFMYVAISGSDQTIAIDLQTREIIARMTTGARPARIDVAILPADRVSDANGR
jgi:YVTN family beta-propeller protein